MNRLLTRILPATVLSAVLLASAGVWARGEGHSFDPQRMIAHMSAELDLTDTQKSQISEVLLSGEEQAQADRERMREIREALEAQRSNFDAGTAQKLADELGQISSRIAYARASKSAGVYELLTEEQRTELDEMREKRGEKREARLGKHRQ